MDLAYKPIVLHEHSTYDLQQVLQVLIILTVYKGLTAGTAGYTAHTWGSVLFLPLQQHATISIGGSFLPVT